jgi:hypothetical protein
MKSVEKLTKEELNEILGGVASNYDDYLDKAKNINKSTNCRCKNGNSNDNLNSGTFCKCSLCPKTTAAISDVSALNKYSNNIQ